MRAKTLSFEGLVFYLELNTWESEAGLPYEEKRGLFVLYGKLLALRSYPLLS